MCKITRAGLRTQSTEKKKIIEDDDDGTVRHHLSNLNGTNEQYIDCPINHGHRVNCCINYVLVCALFTIILLLAYTGTLPFRPMTGPQKLKQANLGQFSIFSLQNWTIFCLNHPYNGLVSFDCSTVLPSVSLKKERLCLKIVLDQA